MGEGVVMMMAVAVAGRAMEAMSTTTTTTAAAGVILPRVVPGRRGRAPGNRRAVCWETAPPGAEVLLLAGGGFGWLWTSRGGFPRAGKPLLRRRASWVGGQAPLGASPVVPARSGRSNKVRFWPDALGSGPRRHRTSARRGSVNCKLLAARRGNRRRRWRRS